MTGRNADADLKIIELHSPPKFFINTTLLHTLSTSRADDLLHGNFFGNLLKLKQFIYYFVNKSLTEYANYGII